MRDNVRRLLKQPDPADWTAFLLGTGGGFLAFGLVGQFFQLFDPTPTTWRMVLGMVFVALSVGLLVPHRLATWVASQMWRRLRGQHPAQPPYSSFLPARKDLPLHRVLLSGLALLCGCTAIVSLGLLRLVRLAYEFLLVEFLWGPVLLVVVECAFVAVVVLLVFVPVGLTWSCIHHLSCPVGGWRVRPLAGVSAGLAIAACAASLSFDTVGGLNPDLLLLMSAVPFFMLSILSARDFAQSRQTTPEVGEEPGRMVPLAHDRWAVLIRTATLITLGCAVLSAGIWWRVFTILATGVCVGGGAALTLWSVGFAIGVARSIGWSRRRTHSIGALGLACTLAGVGTALSAGFLGLLGVRVYPLAGHVAGGYLLSAVIVGFPAFGLGHAVTYGCYAALARVDHQSEIGSVLLSRMMLAAAGATVFVLTPLVVGVGTYAALVAVSLGLVGTGGVLIIHEPAYLLNTRRLRLGIVFASVAFMSLALPHAGVGWLATRPWKRLRLEENAWLTRSIWAVNGDIRRFSEPAGHPVQPIAPSLTSAGRDVHGMVEWRTPFNTLQVALLGAGLQPLAKEIAAARLPCDHLLFDPSVPPGAYPYRATHHDPVPLMREPATRFLRRTARRYDAIVIGVADLPCSAWRPSMRAALLERALDHLRIDGVVLMVVPATQTPRADLLDILAALQKSCCSDFTWTSTSRGTQVTLWLAFGKSAQWRDRWRVRLPRVNRESAELIAALTRLNP